eukprot:COSAG06_NODE_38971_length_417_cov_1.842767_1_plen_83_part_01
MHTVSAREIPRSLHATNEVEWTAPGATRWAREAQAFTWWPVGEDVDDLINLQSRRAQKYCCIFARLSCNGRSPHCTSKCITTH